jgi:hypothetical protein
MIFRKKNTAVTGKSNKKGIPLFLKNIIIAALGFFLSIVLLTWNGCNNNTPFIELKLSKKSTVVHEFLEKRNQDLITLRNRLIKEADSLIGKKKKADSK